MPTQAVNGFQQLLNRLDGDGEIAAGKYELLRRKMIKSLLWRGCAESEADALADAAFDRLTVKIAQGVQIQNFNAYALEVLRFVLLEHNRRRREIAAGDDLPEIAVAPDVEISDDPNLRLSCLKKCLSEVVPDSRDRTLIIGYYDADAGAKNKDNRRTLAEKLGLTATTLKVKACRLRGRLEKCVNECVAESAVTERPDFVTGKRRSEAK